jgi:hypothetical protein
MLCKPQGLVRLEGLGKLKKFIHLIGSRARDFPARSVVSQPTTLPLVPIAPLYWTRSIAYGHIFDILTHCLILFMTSVSLIFIFDKLHDANSK